MQSFFDGITVAEGKKRLGYIIKDQQDQGNLSERKIIPVFVRLDPLPDCQKNQADLFQGNSVADDQADRPSNLQ